MKKTLSFAVLSLFLFSCHKQMAGCLKKEISDFNSKNNCTSAKVDEYRFQDRTVYVFDPGNCGADMTSAVIDEHCNHLGHLGGITGNTTINGENFSNAVFQKNVWSK